MIQLSPTTESVEVEVIVDADGLKIVRDPFNQKFRVFNNGREVLDEANTEWLDGMFRVVNALLDTQGA